MSATSTIPREADAVSDLRRALRWPRLLPDHVTTSTKGVRGRGAIDVVDYTDEYEKRERDPLHALDARRALDLIHCSPPRPGHDRRLWRLANALIHVNDAGVPAS